MNEALRRLNVPAARDEAPEAPVAEAKPKRTRKPRAPKSETQVETQQLALLLDDEGENLDDFDADGELDPFGDTVGNA